VISEADKAKQAVGGVQLVRFSFPPTMDMDMWNQSIDTTIQRTYAPDIKKNRARKWMLPAVAGVLLVCGRMVAK